MNISKIDMDRVLDEFYEKKIKDPNTPEDEREIFKALLSVSPYKEKKRKKKRNRKNKVGWLNPNYLN